MLSSSAPVATPFVARGPTWLRTVTPFATAGIVLVVGIMAYIGTRREAESTSLVEYTHQVIDGNQELLARVIDAETGERGYVITGNDRYLIPYEGAGNDARRIIQRLHTLTGDDPAQQARLDTLGTLVDRRLASLSARVAARHSGGFVAARDSIAMGSGEATMDSIRAVAAAIEVGEQRLLQQRHQSADAHTRTVVAVIVSGTAASIAIALVLNLMLGRYAASQERLVRRLEDQNGELEAQAIELEETHAKLLARTREAEDANRAKSNFLARISHDLRTPLNAIGGYVDLMELGLRGPVTDAQRTDLGRIKRSGKHLLGLIEHVLNFSKLEAGKVRLDLAPLHLHEVLSEIEPFVAPQITAKGLAFTLGPCGDDVIVIADPEKLDQNINNIVTKSYKFTPSGGHVAVECETSVGAVAIHVRDTGRGIPADKIGSIFEPFVQIEDRRGDGSGVGLGLAITRELATALGGTLHAESTIDVGSTFTLTLPRTGENGRQPRD